MIIGHGDIASVLKDRDDFLYFASGVSNSLETDWEAFAREEQLLYAQAQDKHLVYFSSLSVFYKDSPYTRHKRKMEELIRRMFQFQGYTIVRIGNITWGTNPHTLINYFRNQIAKGESIEVRDEYRYIIDKDEFLHWVDLIPKWNCEFNITGQRMSIKEIVNKYVHLGISAK